MSRATALAGLALVAPLFRRHRWRLAGGLVCLAAVNLLQLVTPLLARRVVDGLAAGDLDRAGVARLALAVVAVAVVIAGCRFGWRYLVIGFSRLLEEDLRLRFVQRILQLDQPFFHRHPPGAVMALATNDMAAVQLAFGMGLVATADALGMSVAVIACMTWLSPRLTGLAVLPLPVLAVATLFLSRRVHRGFRLVQESFGRITEFARSALAAVRLLQAYTQETAQVRYLDRLGRDYVHHNLALARVQGVLYPLSGFIGNCCLLMVVFFGGRMVIGQAITIGDFTAFMSYLFMLVWPMMAIGWVTNLFQRGLTSLARLQEVFTAVPRLTEPADPVPLPQGKDGEVRLACRGLTFAYDDGGPPVLHGIHLEAGRGLLGIVGPTGCGKSTLCRVLARLYPVADGHLFYQGVDANRLSPAAVRQRIAYVPQDPVFFSGTIWENLTLGAPEADEAAVERAARLAMLHDDVAAMADGYQTRVGERGIQLSGGQRQRLSLARALLVDRPVLIIDDALSAVDTETEAAIVANLRDHLATRTTIFASHRLAPLVAAREILVLERGRVTARGDHQTLLAANAYYRAVYQHQAAGTGTGGGDAL